MSALGDAVAGLVSTLQGVAGDSMIYSRGSVSVTLTVIQGQTTFEQESEAGIVRWEAKDFLIKATDLVLDDVVVEPKRGDLITAPSGNVFKVLGDGGVPAFRYCDAYRHMLRVHTKQV